MPEHRKLPIIIISTKQTHTSHTGKMPDALTLYETHVEQIPLYLAYLRYLTKFRTSFIAQLLYMRLILDIHTQYISLGNVSLMDFSITYYIF